jgi:hypothetical protein
LKNLIQLAIFLLSWSSLASSELLDQHKKICEGHEKKDCRVLIIPQRSVDKVINCSGVLVGRFQCTVSLRAGSAMNLTCGAPENPILYQDFTATEFNYKVAAIVKDDMGSDRVISDNGIYTAISNNLLTVNLVQLGNERTHFIALNFPDDGTPLENLVCE